MTRVSFHAILSVLFISLPAFLHGQEFSSSNLPIIVIETDGAPIVDAPKITAHMGVIDNGPGNRNNLSDPFNHYDGFIAIEIRGNASQFFDKKPYVFETRTAAGEEFNTALLGLPPESDWILSAAYIDKSL